MNNQDVMAMVRTQSQSSAEGGGVHFFEGNELLSLASEKLLVQKSIKVPISIRSVLLRPKVALILAYCVLFPPMIEFLLKKIKL